MRGHHRKPIKQRLKWWWSTRVLGLFNIRLKRMFQFNADAPRTVFEFEKMAPPLSERDDEGITVILTAYRRVEYLAEQIKAIRAQTQSPFEKSMDNEMQRTQIKLDRILSIIEGLSEAMVERVEEAKKLVKEL